MNGLTPKLLATYDIPTPRYTSYPTALAFEPMTELPSADGATSPVSLYFHMVFCRSLCWYCACTKEITRRQARSGAYLDQLMRELELRADRIAGRPIVQMHLGGGTPTFWTAEELGALTRFVRDRFDVTEDAELSIEIDPRELSDDHVSMLAGAGFTRASIGVQDHNPEVQAAIHRDQPLEVTAHAVNRLRAAGIDNINFDLVYGLPAQTPESFRRTAEDIVGLGPSRLAVYSYAHVPWAAPAQKLVTRTHPLPAADAKIAMFLAAADVFEHHGYRHIGMDHFAKADDSLTVSLDAGTMQRNFMGYTTHAGVDIEAFGVSAISQTRDAYFQNDRDLAKWGEAIDEGTIPVLRGIVLTEEDKLRREIIMAVMCGQPVDFTSVGEAYGVDARELLAEASERLEPLEADGLVVRRGDELHVTPLGRYLVRCVAAAFDPTVGRREGYSRAV